MALKTRTPAEQVSVTRRPQPNAWPVITPAVDIAETDAEWLLWIDLPRVKADQINLQVERGRLILEAPMNLDFGGTETNYLVDEQRRGHYRRVFVISEGVDVARIGADYRLGVLTITLPKASTAKAHRIAVKTD